MKRFRFSLQGALVHRLHQQEQAQRVLGEAQNKLRECQELQSQLESEAQDVERSRPSSGPAEVILHSLRYLETLRVAILRAQEQVEEARQGVEKARTDLAERNRDVKAMEILRDNQKEAFRKSQNVAETKLLDDLAGISTLRAEPKW